MDIAQEKARLSVILQARQTALAEAETFVRVENDLEPAEPEFLRKIAWNYPREDDGRLPLGEAVLLAPADSVPIPNSKRSLWLAATAPQRRRDPQIITVGTRWLIGENHAHRWDKAHWLWDPHTEATESERWGVTGLAPLWQTAPDTALGSDGLRASQCILLQDAGRFTEAFGLYGVTMTEDILSLLSGDLPAGHPHHYSSWHAERFPGWASALRQAFHRCAPWRFRDVLTDNEESPKKSRSRRPPLPPVQPAGADPAEQNIADADSLWP